MKIKIGLFFVTLTQLAHGQAATNSPPATELKNPVVLHVLQDGKVVPFSGQWLYTKDGTPVFVAASPSSKTSPTATAPAAENGQPFILLVPAAVSAPVVLQPQYYYGNEFAAQTAYATPNWYYPNRGWYGGWSGGRHYYHYGASVRNWGNVGPRFVLHPDGARRLAPTHSLRENPQFYERSPGVFALAPTRAHAHTRRR